MLRYRTMYQTWARSTKPRLSYSWLTTAFSSVLEGAPKRQVFWKEHGPICTKFGGNIVRLSLHTKFKKSSDILLRFETRAAQSWASLSGKDKCRTLTRCRPSSLEPEVDFQNSPLRNLIAQQSAKFQDDRFMILCG